MFDFNPSSLAIAQLNRPSTPSNYIPLEHPFPAHEDRLRSDDERQACASRLAESVTAFITLSKEFV